MGYKLKKRGFPRFTNNCGGTIIQRLLGMRNPRPKTGNKTFLDPSAQFIGADYIEIGHRSIVSEGCWFNVSDRSGTEPRILIGDHCIISRRVFMNSGKRIVFGPHCLIGNESNFLGADHDFSDPFRPFLVAPSPSGEEITVEGNCWMGSNCIVLKGVTIGFGCVIGAGSMVTKSIPPLSVAIGSPCRAIKRFRISQKMWVPVSEWTQEDEDSIPTLAEYLNTLREKYEWVSMPYIIGGGWFGNM